MRRLLPLAVAIVILTTPGLPQTYRHKTPVASQKTPKAQEPELAPVPLPEEPGVYAVLYTSMGNIVCRLFDKQDPNTVSNFRGLATGTKPWKDPTTGKMKHTSLYTGTTFHRVIPDFMIQGGDPTGTGTGEPGFKFDNEIDGVHKFDKPGVLAMANSGPNTNGCQFFITVAPAEHLDGNYNIFGEVVSGQEVADAISKVPRNSDDKPDTPVKIIAIKIRTVPAGGESKPGSAH